MSWLAALILAAACFRADTIPTDGRFSAGAMPYPRDGYTDSPFINAQMDREYFAHSYLTPTDFLGTTTGMDAGEVYAGRADGGVPYDTDLYFTQWDEATHTWSYPINQGSGDGSGTNSLNSFGNDCCQWLNPDETKTIVYTDNLGLGGVRATGNYLATRANRDAGWSPPTALPGQWGTQNQNPHGIYRHDLLIAPITGDVYGWEKNVDAGTSRLVWGQNDAGTWGAPVDVPGVSPNIGNTQPWISPDELVLEYNQRGASGDTSLMISTRSSTTSSWSAGTPMTLIGFADPNGKLIWGEPGLPRSGFFMTYVGFDTSRAGWPTSLYFVRCSPGGTCSAPVKLTP